MSDSEIAVATQAGEDSGATVSAIYILDVDPGRSLTSKAALESKGNFVGSLTYAAGSVFAVDRIDGVDSLIKVDASAQESGRIPLEGNIVAGPWATDSGIIVQLDSDQIALFDFSLARQWVRKN